MSQSRGAPWFPVKMIHQLVARRATPIRKLYTLNDRVCQHINDESAEASFSKMVVTPFCG